MSAYKTPLADERSGGTEAAKRFENDMKHTISCIAGGVATVTQKVIAELTLHPEYRVRIDHEIKMHNCGAKNWPLIVEEQYRLLATAFYALLERGAFDLPNGINDESNAEIAQLQVFLELREAPPKPLSAEERLRQEVLIDFNGQFEESTDEHGKKQRVCVKQPLRAEDFRRKLQSNSAYRECYQKLAETDAISMAITTVHGQ
jgi:hypothetical protein